MGDGGSATLKMKILILTQKVDVNDPILGFFHRWIEEFSKHCERVTVICLQGGEHNLPKNVKVLSLGKNNLELSTLNFKLFQKFKYVLNFWKYIWQERHNYDSVFVHMNSEYVVLGGVLWKVWRKKIMLWNNHLVGNFATRLAVRIVDKSFYTSPFSFNAKMSGPKGRRMPVGIDTDTFKRDARVIRAGGSVLSLGRISPVKNLEVIVKAAILMDEDGERFILNIVGDSLIKDKDYFNKIQKMASELEVKSEIFFNRAVSNHLTPQIYNQNEMFVNATNSGSLDKTIMEALACEMMVVVSNRSLEEFLPPEMIFEEGDPTNLKEKMSALLRKSHEEKEKLGRTLREKVVKGHSLGVLINKILAE